MVSPRPQPTRSKKAASSLPSVASKNLSKEREKPAKARWTFLTNHAHVLILLSLDSSLVLREVALQIGITERAVQRIIADLEQDGFIAREKVGRNNQYRISSKLSLRHPIESHRTIGDLLALMIKKR